jgi:hypothetical protein
LMQETTLQNKMHYYSNAVITDSETNYATCSSLCQNTTLAV